MLNILIDFPAVLVRIHVLLPTRATMDTPLFGLKNNPNDRALVNPKSSGFSCVAIYFNGVLRAWDSYSGTYIALFIFLLKTVFFTYY